MLTTIAYLRRNFIALLALFLALGGTSYAALSLPTNSVGTRQLKNQSVTGAKVKPGTLSISDFRGRLPAGRAGRNGTNGTDGAPGPTGAGGPQGTQGSIGQTGQPGVPGALVAGNLNSSFASNTGQLPGANSGQMQLDPNTFETVLDLDGQGLAGDGETSQGLITVADGQQLAAQATLNLVDAGSVTGVATCEMTALSAGNSPTMGVTQSVQVIGVQPDGPVAQLSLVGAAKTPAGSYEVAVKCKGPASIQSEGGDLLVWAG
jgi:hypothetical protein